MVRYECPICGNKYNTTTVIKFHIETYHPDEFREFARVDGKPVDICVKCYPYAPYVNAPVVP